MFGRLQGSAWGRLHEESELLAIMAQALQNSHPTKAREFYSAAAKKEEEALQHIPKDLQKTYEIMAYSTAVLYYKGADFINARRVAEGYRNTLVDPFSISRLEEVLEALDAQN